nr:reverse transcriptase domain-containing protein [Tanacetum cinerariifolium]
MAKESSEWEREVAAMEEVLVNPSFPDQKAYVDDMVIKSKDEKMLLADIAETFDNLKKINMKLNPKKCSFGVEEGKFLGYIVTSKGIRANPKMTKALAGLQSPRTLKEMQSLSGKLTKEAEEAFQQIKNLIMDLPSLTPPWEKETLYTYLVVSAKAVSAVLLTDRKGRQCPVQKAVRQGYYWPTIHEDAKKEVEKCDSCQIHASVPRLSKTLMTSIMAPWPFYQWGMDILGPLPPAMGGAKFVIVAIDYFTKWIKAKPLVKITSNELIRFVMDNIICRFGLSRIIITDNGAQLVNDPFKSWYGRFEIHQMNTTVEHPQANGLVERANTSLMEGIKTRLEREKSGWVDELPNVLWAHRTSIKKSNGETPFSLACGSEAVISVEIGIPTYRTLTIREGYNEEEMRLNLDLLQERRETAAIREARYKTKME